MAMTDKETNAAPETLINALDEARKDASYVAVKGAVGKAADEDRMGILVLPIAHKATH